MMVIGLGKPKYEESDEGSKDESDKEDEGKESGSKLSAMAEKRAAEDMLKAKDPAALIKAFKALHEACYGGDE